MVVKQEFSQQEPNPLRDALPLPPRLRSPILAWPGVAGRDPGEALLGAQACVGPPVRLQGPRAFLASRSRSLPLSYLQQPTEVRKVRPQRRTQRGQCSWGPTVLTAPRAFQEVPAPSPKGTMPWPGLPATKRGPWAARSRPQRRPHPPIRERRGPTAHISAALPPPRPPPSREPSGRTWLGGGRFLLG